MLDPRESFLLGGGNDFAVAKDRGGAVVIKGADSEDVHDLKNR
jgi:hypothetical protein